MLTPIESHLRHDDVRDWVLVIRGRPLSVEGLLAAAARTRAEFSWHGQPVAAISAEVTGPARSTDDVLAGPRLRTRRTYAATPVANLLNNGFPVLATFAEPHVSIILPEYTAAQVQTLIELFGRERPNPYYLRTSR